MGRENFAEKSPPKPERYEPWWLKENEIELGDILFNAAKDFVAEIDPSILVEREKYGITFRFFNNKDGSIDKRCSVGLSITGALFEGDNREDFEKYAHAGFLRDHVLDAIVSLSGYRMMVESGGAKVSNDKEKSNTGNREFKEDEPKINLRILYSPHYSGEDFNVLADELSRVDIYFPENAGWNTETEKAYQVYATGKYEIPENFDPVLKSELETLSDLGKSGKKIEVGFIDLPKGHPFLHPPVSSEKAVAEFEKGNFNKAIREIKKIAGINARIDQLREDYIQRQIHHKIRKILEARPALKKKLKQKEGLNILLGLGSMHTGIFHNLKREGENVERRFSPRSFEFDAFNELTRRYVFGKKVNNELAARALLSSELLPDLAFIDDIAKIYKVANKIVSRLTLDDIRKISTRIKSGFPVAEAIKDFDVNVPKTKIEADQFIGP